MRAVHKRYLREFFPALLGYMLLLGVSLSTVRGLDSTAARAVVTLLPVVPIAFLIRAIVRVIRDQDELERLIDLESCAIAGAVAGFGFFGYGMLLNASVVSEPPADAVAIWVLPTLLGCFGLVKVVVARHYRNP